VYYITLCRNNMYLTCNTCCCSFSWLCTNPTTVNFIVSVDGRERTRAWRRTKTSKRPVDRSPKVNWPLLLSDLTVCLMSVAWFVLKIQIWQSYYLHGYQFDSIRLVFTCVGIRDRMGIRVITHRLSKWKLKNGVGNIVKSLTKSEDSEEL